MNKLWYDLVYEDEFHDDGETHDINRVLYTSNDGLQKLTNELQNISNQSNGRHKFSIDGVDEDYEPPFDFIELSERPPEEKKSEEDGINMFYIIFGCAATVIVLALTGLASIVRWAFF